MPTSCEMGSGMKRRDILMAAGALGAGMVVLGYVHEIIRRGLAKPCSFVKAIGNIFGLTELLALFATGLIAESDLSAWALAGISKAMLDGARQPGK